jgi:hypothetical protein
MHAVQSRLKAAKSKAAELQERIDATAAAAAAAAGSGSMPNAAVVSGIDGFSRHAFSVSEVSPGPVAGGHGRDDSGRPSFTEMHLLVAGSVDDSAALRERLLRTNTRIQMCAVPLLSFADHASLSLAF